MHKKIRCFILLKDLNIHKSYREVFSLKKILALQAKIKNQIDILMSYQKEYSERLDKEFKYSISGVKMMHLYNFILFLKDGIQKHQEAFQKSVCEYNNKIFLWKQIQIKIQMWKKIISKLSLQNSQFVQLEQLYEVNSLCVQKYFFGSFNKVKSDYV